MNKVLSNTKPTFIRSCKSFTCSSSWWQSGTTTVLYSKSTCPFENLAFEDYVYEKVTFENTKRLLFIWRNKPTIVIGRHQNPWMEVNLKEVYKNEINLCRRKSGGGSVYHDLGNINLTFFTNRKDYNRKKNLDFIIRILSGIFHLNVQRNEKDDILLNGEHKVSGTAAKLGLNTAYHHCTLLCKTDMNALSGLLNTSFGDIETNATKSLPSPTANLFPDNFEFIDIFKVFGQQYHESYNINTSMKPLYGIDPLQFPLVPDKVNELTSWDWVYGKSPKFTVNNTLILANGTFCELSFNINKGSIVNITVENHIGTNYSIHCLINKLIGSRYNYMEVQDVLKFSIKDNDAKNYCKQILDCLN